MSYSPSNDDSMNSTAYSSGSEASAAVHISIASLPITPPTPERAPKTDFIAETTPPPSVYEASEYTVPSGNRADDFNHVEDDIEMNEVGEDFPAVPSVASRRLNFGDISIAAPFHSILIAQYNDAGVRRIAADSPSSEASIISTPTPPDFLNPDHEDYYKNSPVPGDY